MADVKGFVCMCERVTLEDLEKAFEEGFRDVESMRRRLRIGMGPCQGRYCTPLVIGFLSRKLGVPPEKIAPPLVRPPLEPAPARLFMGEELEG